MTPAEDLRDRRELDVALLGVLAGVPFRRQEDADRPVGHLRAVRDLEASTDHLVESVGAVCVQLTHVPATRLRQWVLLCVRVVDRRYAGEVLVLQAETLVIL